MYILGISAYYHDSAAALIQDGEIIAAVQEEPNPGGLNLADLKNYKTVIRPVICGSFRDMKICTSSPPSSG